MIMNISGILTNRFLRVLCFALFLVFAWTASAREYTATVTPLKVIKHGAGTNAAFYGSVDYVAQIGQIIKPPVTDENGNVIEGGDLLMTLKKDYWEEQLKGAQAQANAAYAVMLDQRNNFMRYKSLVGPRAVSEETFESYFSSYASALNKYLNQKNNIIQAEEFLKSAKYYSPFTGIITKVLFSGGLTGSNEDTIEITQLDPIGITVKMSREEARKIGTGTPVKVYIPGEKAPQGILYDRTLLTDDGIEFVTENYPVIPKSPASVSERNISDVTSFYIDSSDKTYGVPDDSVQKDGKGLFVWRVKGQQQLVPGDGLNDTFTVEKAYVRTQNLYRQKTGNVRLVALADPGSLRLNDIILRRPSPDLKENEKVVFPPDRFVLMPGEQVKVEVDTSRLDP